jgi:hypothetical protein
MHGLIFCVPSFPILRRGGWSGFVATPEEMKMKIVDGLARHESEGGGAMRVEKSKDQANRADLFFGWNRVDKAY